MSQKRLSMRKIRELMRLKYELGRSHREIAASLGIANSTVSDYASRARAAGPLLAVAGEAGRRRSGGGAVPTASALAGSPSRAGLDRVHRELQRHKGVTLRLLWLEYRTVHPDGYGYSRFCDRYRLWRGRRDVVLLRCLFRRSRPPIPSHAVHRFRGELSGDTGRSRPAVGAILNNRVPPFFHRRSWTSSLGRRDGRPGTSPSTRYRRISTPTSGPTTGTVHTAAAAWRRERRIRSSRMGSESPGAARSQRRRR